MSCAVGCICVVSAVWCDVCYRKLKAADHQNEVSLGQARDLETLKRDLDKLEAANKALSAQLRETKDSLTEVTESRNQYRDSSESLDVKCKDLEARLATALAEAKTATEQNNATRKRFDGMEANIRVRPVGDRVARMTTLVLWCALTLVCLCCGRWRCKNVMR